ncbi:hypothetical protein PPYR_14620 [Photinus pyralis]|uniref:Protein krueppel n=1 Tax=Photinus pyralis TaxID=7054 RepID=A0A1Y1K098_PHOPY|nr:uncharacterized protein LOC116180238 [Photinus pyralis]KAB0792661.1 hypothetical protein PPYR_14620 [Photinus pyralis]
MSKRHPKEPKRALCKRSDKFDEISTRNDGNFVLEIVIGSINVKRWNQLKITLSCTTNEELSTFLLDLAEKYLKENKLASLQSEIRALKKIGEESVPEVEHSTADDHQNVAKNDRSKRRKIQDKETVVQITTQEENEDDNVNDTKQAEPITEDVNLEAAPPVDDSKGIDKIRKHRRKEKENADKNKTLEKQKKKTNNYDIRKAPELNEQIEEKADPDGALLNEGDLDPQRVAIKIKLCCTCGTRHIQDHCPLQNPHFVVHDSLRYEEWSEKYKPLYEQQLHVEDSQENKENITFSFLSLPHGLQLNEVNGTEELCIVTSITIKEFTQFGPLFGKTVKEVDISEDFNMKHLWEIYSDKSHIYVNTEDLNESNWIRFVRPAPTRDERNVTAISRNCELFLVSVKEIGAGQELLYWQDDVLSTTKKKMEKTTCGGCNMTFCHPLYYRTHCSIFHDIRYSLTIRKYHCKVCGVAVLGKENIMKHAAELHNGQGAYQCQFCKKFFLRLNYLEMHRTYGCSANPHRSRPLCDFCGRKFCQPQKLKVHIKRMHSDLAEVLKEFQCKSCMKLLGSRAALQRHMKEVHNKQLNGACACSRCGKLFQNKSNLKIHMLTHSGIKPFRCMERNCNAAFTTKQCLQFHYKKVHGFTDDMMPKIKRSVDYTFEAYSGDRDQDQDGEIVDKISDTGNENNFLNDVSDDENSLDDKNLDDPPAVCSPPQLATEHSSVSNSSPPALESYSNSNLKILSKGSKKWLGDDPLPTLKNEIYRLSHVQDSKISNSDIGLDVNEQHAYERTKLSMNLNVYSRHESSNASLLVEAALDSVTDIHCSDSTINIDVDSTPTGTEVLVNNLCTLTHPDTLSDVPYNHSVDLGESRDINLISPSVNEPISVTDGENMGIDYSNFHHNDFSPTNSPGLQHRADFNRDYIDVGQVSPQDLQSYNSSHEKNLSPGVSPPRYNFGHSISADHVSSDDSNGMSVQNLSLHGAKNDVQLDLSIYKSPYLDTNFQLRKDLGMKLNLEPERKQVYVLEINDGKMYHDNALNDECNKYDLPSESSERDQVESFDSNMCNKDFENIDSDDIKHKVSELRSKYEVESLASEIRNKQFEIDLNLRTKSYDLANRSVYDSAVDGDFRVKGYDIGEGVDVRNNLIESEFRLDRNFEPIILNSTELQGLDMSARSYHNYHSSQNLNRYHHLYPDVERSSVDLRLNYSPPLPSYPHADVLRVVSLDLTSPGRHSVDLSLRSNPLHVHQLGNSRLLTDHSIQANRILNDHNRLGLDQSRLLSSELNTSRPRLIADTGNRVLSDHSTNRLLSSEQLSGNHLLGTDESRLLEQSRIISDSRILPASTGNGSVSPLPYGTYSVSPTPYHPTPLTSRSHTTSPTPSPYHHYSSYY